jgi:hypothetical protein
VVTGCSFCGIAEQGWAPAVQRCYKECLRAKGTLTGGNSELKIFTVGALELGRLVQSCKERDG